MNKVEKEFAPTRRYRLAILNSHPIQYFAPLYRRLSKEPKIDLTVYYCSQQGAKEYLDKEFGQKFKWDIPLLEGYNYKFLDNFWKKDKVGNFFSLVNPGIIIEIFRNHYDAVWIHGYRYFSNWLTLLTSRFSKTAIFYRSESSLTYDTQVRRPFYIRLLKSFILNFIFRQASSFLSIGTLNRDFYLHYGVPAEKIFHVPYTIDNEYFRQKTEEFHLGKAKIRDGMGIGQDDTVFLFAAKMTSQKAPLELLQAYEQLTDLPRKALIMVGDGELRAKAEAYVANHHIANVYFAGFINQGELPKYYAISDVFVRPDGIYQGDWGLSVNEAMAAGLAIISTDMIAATVDLVKENENGIAVEFRDINKLSAAMRRMIIEPGICRRMGEKSLQIISNWSFEQCVSGILQALDSLIEHSERVMI